MKNTKYKMKSLSVIIILLTFFSCNYTVVRVEKVPANTPPGAQIFITGNFNLWDPGDRTYQLMLNSDKTMVGCEQGGSGKTDLNEQGL